MFALAWTAGTIALPFVFAAAADADPDAAQELFWWLAGAGVGLFLVVAVGGGERRERRLLRNGVTARTRFSHYVLGHGRVYHYRDRDGVEHTFISGTGDVRRVHYDPRRPFDAVHIGSEPSLLKAWVWSLVGAAVTVFCLARAGSVVVAAFSG
jgi:hypothetical protein